MSGLRNRLPTVAIATLLAGPGAIPLPACNVPVFRYALERWEPDAHIVSVGEAAPVSPLELNGEHDANLWVEKQGEGRRVKVLYPQSDIAWFEGVWEDGILDRLADSPLRRKILRDLLRGNTAVCLLLRGADEERNRELAAMMRQVAKEAAEELQIADTLDFGDGVPASMVQSSGVPVRIAFTQYEVARDDPAESVLVRQLTAGESPEGRAKPMLAFVFGRGRTVAIPGGEVNLEVLRGLYAFLCGPCSCQVKALNPGFDLLLTLNWDEAVYTYPEIPDTRLPSGERFRWDEAADE